MGTNIVNNQINIMANQGLQRTAPNAASIAKETILIIGGGIIIVFMLLLGLNFFGEIPKGITMEELVTTILSISFFAGLIIFAYTATYYSLDGNLEMGEVESSVKISVVGLFLVAIVFILAVYQGRYQDAVSSSKFLLAFAVVLFIIFRAAPWFYKEFFADSQQRSNLGQPTTRKHSIIKIGVIAILIIVLLQFCGNTLRQHKAVKESIYGSAAGSQSSSSPASQKPAEAQTAPQTPTPADWGLAPQAATPATPPVSTTAPENALD